MSADDRKSPIAMDASSPVGGKGSNVVEIRDGVDADVLVSMVLDALSTDESSEEPHSEASTGMLLVRLPFHL